MSIGTIAAIVVNWHRWELTLKCVQSLENARGSLRDVKMHILIVDNESDGVSDAVPPDIVTIPVPENLGYGAGNNLGVAEAMKLQPAPDAIFILNNDATIDASSLQSLIDELQSHPDVGVAAPVLTSADGAIESAGGHFGRRRAWWTETIPDGPVDFVSGAAFLIKQDAWNQVGGFDERYFHYVEDLDLGWQLTKAGWKLLVVPDARVTHLKSQSSTSTAANPLLAYYTIRNQLLFLRKEKSFHVVGPNVLWRMCRNLVPIRHMLRGDFHTLRWVWRGLWDGLAGRRGRVNQ